MELQTSKTSSSALEMGNCQRIQDKEESHVRTCNDEISPEHPLNNSLIFDLIFQYIPKWDWKSARRVNKKWHAYIQPRWREQMAYQLGHGKGCPEVHTVTAKFLEKKHPTKNRKDPLQLTNHPIQHIFIPSCGNDDNKQGLLHPDQIRFWELFGPGLKSLRLDGVRIHKIAFFKRILFELTPNLEEFRYSDCICEDIDKLQVNTVTEYTPPVNIQKNLKSLDISIANWYFDEDVSDSYRARFLISWIELFSVFPNIRKLKLEIDPLLTKRPSDLLKLFEAIDIVRKATNNQTLNITELRLNFYGVGFEHVDVIKNQSVFASLPISTLYIPTSFRGGTEKKIALVRTFASSLQDLILLGPGPGELFPNDMLGPGLTKLGLISSGSCFSSLEFLSHTPNLEELELLEDITHMLQPEVCTELANVAPLVNLKRLRFILPDGTPPVEMEILGKLMPNVKSCICNVGFEGFQTLCQMWPNLEHLNLEVHFSSEDFFVKNLIQLKCLKTLQIQKVCGKLSDKFIFEGLLMMPSLTRIYLDSNQLTDQGRDSLKGKLCDYPFDDWNHMFRRLND